MTRRSIEALSAPAGTLAPDPRPEPARESRSTPPSPGFLRVLCAVDGSCGALEATRQAAALTGPGGVLTILAVAGAQPGDPRNRGRLAEWHAAQAVGQAAVLARDAGALVRTRVHHAADPATAILSAAPAFDLVVCGVPGQTRSGEVAAWTTAARVARAIPVPLLLARRPHAGRFPGDVVLAATGGADAAAADVTARVALAGPAGITIVDAAHTAASAELTADLAAATGWPGDGIRLARTTLEEAVAAVDPGLIVAAAPRRAPGARARPGERLALDAACSVLLVPPASPREGLRRNRTAA